MKIFAVVNQKGGVGKTTVCVQTAFAGVARNLRVLLVGLDPQDSLSYVFPIQSEGASTASALFAKDSVIRPEVLSANISIIRGDKFLQHLTSQNKEGLKRPAQYLRALSSEYDLCIIDTPGALGENAPTTTAALIAAHSVVCPFAVGALEATPLSELWVHLQNVRRGDNPHLKILGLLPSKVNVKSEEELAALENLRAHPHVGKNILPVALGERAAVKQAIAKRKPVWVGVRGSGHKSAAHEWKSATDAILDGLGFGVSK